MLTKKKRRMIKIIIPVIIFILLIAIFVILYLKTDMFKSDETLFFKYLGKNSENISNIQNMLENEAFSEELKSKKYTENDQFIANYAENYNTTSENTDNLINKLILNINRKIDAENNYKNYDIELLNQNDESLQLEVLKNNDNYQITFPQLFSQSIETENLDYLIKQSGYGSEEIENILNMEILEKLKFNEEELENLKNKYIERIKAKTTNHKFSKKSNQKITIDQKQFTANEYTLTMSKEDFNELYVDILNELKNDEIILKKVKDIQEIYNLLLSNIKVIDLELEYVDWIEETIEKVNRTNIGTEEVKIIVYENKGKTISTIIEASEYEIDFDNLYNDESFTELAIKYKENQEITIGIRKEKDSIKFTAKNTKDNNGRTFEIEENNTSENDKYQKNTCLKYKDKTNSIELNYDRDIEVVNSLDKIGFNENNIKLDELEQEQLEKITKTMTDNIVNKTNEIFKNVNLEEDIIKIYKNIGFVKDAEEIVSEGISDSEKNRHNSKYEILKGDELTSQDILRIIDEIGNNIKNLQVESKNKLKIEINEQNNNLELVQKLKDVIEKNKSKKYNVDIEYDEIGLVKYIVLTIIEDKR